MRCVRVCVTPMIAHTWDIYHKAEQHQKTKPISGDDGTATPFSHLSTFESTCLNVLTRVWAVPVIRSVWQASRRCYNIINILGTNNTIGWLLKCSPISHAVSLSLSLCICCCSSIQLSNDNTAPCWKLRKWQNTHRVSCKKYVKCTKMGKHIQRISSAIAAAKIFFHFRMHSNPTGLKMHLGQTKKTHFELHVVRLCLCLIPGEFFPDKCKQWKSRDILWCDRVSYILFQWLKTL